MTVNFPEKIDVERKTEKSHFKLQHCHGGQFGAFNLKKCFLLFVPFLIK